ncbi:RNA-processing protein [Infirmifilum lucidum]|uniref:RNA-processing protein n=1 Tax=Infirmifilum lucidum TaxID=2776706 RepID=A0A7L9FEF2_9CREN|nr:KH domain-containing protein [Infirmifilum lucidum]QOJ78178.1 RNA-processing protein [Infirmifilum lucidum]
MCLALSISGRLPIPVDPQRLGVVIGRGGLNKSRIEEEFHVRVEVDSEKGLVFVEPKEGATMYNVFRAKKAIEALALGFPLEDVLLLTDDVYDFEVLDLSEVARNQSDLVRIKARIIGSEGRFKKTLEEIVGVRVVVGDKVVGLIGDFEQLRLAKEAISRLVRGQSHQTVTRFLERESFGLKRRRMELWERWSQV